MEFDLDEAMAALSRTPAALKAMLNGLPRNWVENNEGPETSRRSPERWPNSTRLRSVLGRLTSQSFTTGNHNRSNKAAKGKCSRFLSSHWGM